MAKWQYAVTIRKAPTNTLELANELNEEAEEGWELVSIRDIGSGNVEVIYKKSNG